MEEQEDKKNECTHDGNKKCNHAKVSRAGDHCSGWIDLGFFF